ncbi:MAG: IS1 family transposase [Terriglobales bacterium]|jgi:IS1 family transposase/transposase-like protein
MMNTEKAEKTMTCSTCNVDCQRFGSHRNGLRRFRCPQCKRTYTEPHIRTLDTMYIPEEKAVLVMRLLLEGNSIRSSERISGLDRTTIARLLVLAGERCEKLLADTITNLRVRDVEADEMWGFVGMKEKAKGNLHKNEDSLGDAYTYVALERNSKLILAWHLGKRNRQDTLAFVLKLRNATEGRFQLTTDGWPSYPDAVERVFGSEIDYAQLVKVYAATRDGEQRYSPAEVVDVEVVPRAGMPDYERICTSHVERQNLTMRMQIRRLTRLTNAFSKKWENLRAAIALHFAYYNFCRIHQSLRVTPAMEAGLTDHVWELKELLAA